MEMTLTIDVSTLNSAFLSALEDVMGLRLRSSQRLVVHVVEAEASNNNGVGRPRQTVDDLPDIFEGLADEQIEATERDIKTRANLTRNLPYAHGSLSVPPVSNPHGICALAPDFASGLFDDWRRFVVG